MEVPEGMFVQVTPMFTPPLALQPRFVKVIVGHSAEAELLEELLCEELEELDDGQGTKILKSTEHAPPWAQCTEMS
jgi:hypothetical protein